MRPRCDPAQRNHLRKLLLLRGRANIAWGTLIASFLTWILVIQKAPSCERFSSQDAEIISVRGEYLVVFPGDPLLERTMGPSWRDEEIYYACYVGLTSTGARANVDPEFTPLGRGQPVIVVTGTEWDRIPCLLYNATTRMQAPIEVRFSDSPTPVVAVTRAPSLRPRSGRLMPEKGGVRTLE